jgi:hypothetical protein
MRFPFYVSARFQWFFFAALFLLTHVFIARNMYFLSRDMQSGDFSAKRIKPGLLFRAMRIPNSALAANSDAHNRLAADFAQVYFPSQNIERLNENYRNGSFEPWARSSRYAPLIHHLCAITYCKLDYGAASLVHIAAQVILFYAAFIAAFVILKIVKYLPWGILLLNIFIFLTPAGLSWIERGQFSLYVGMSYLFVLLGIVKKNPCYFFLGGLFAFIKWTSLPALFVILSVFLFTSGNLKEFKARFRLVLPFPAVMILLIALAPFELVPFLQGLFQQEAFASPKGVSLAKLLPVEIVKFIPLVLIGLGLLYVRKSKNNPDACLPFYAGACILMLNYPTIAYEYNMTTLACFIPFLAYWIAASSDAAQAQARRMLGYVFLLFLITASHFVDLYPVVDLGYINFYPYLITAAIFMLAPLIITPKDVPL